MLCLERAFFLFFKIKKKTPSSLCLWSDGRDCWRCPDLLSWQSAASTAITLPVSCKTLGKQSIIPRIPLRGWISLVWRSQIPGGGHSAARNSIPWLLLDLTDLTGTSTSTQEKASLLMYKLHVSLYGIMLLLNTFQLTQWCADVHVYAGKLPHLLSQRKQNPSSFNVLWSRENIYFSLSFSLEFWAHNVAIYLFFCDQSSKQKWRQQNVKNPKYAICQVSWSFLA